MTRLREDVIWRELHGEIVVLEVTTGRYLGVNPTGAALWPLIVEGATEEAMVDALVARYDVDVARATDDVANFVGWLHDQQLLASARPR